MAMWLQKIVLTVVAIVPVIAGEIVRMTDTPTAPPRPVIAPSKAVVRPPCGTIPDLPTIAATRAKAGEAGVRGC